MAETDEKLPVYLLLFLLRIRRHAGELDYFSKRFDSMPMDKMVIETQMVKLLFDRGLINLPSNKCEKFFEHPSKTFSCGNSPNDIGLGATVPYWEFFALTPAGKYVIIEGVASAVAGALKTFAIAVIGAVVALLASS